MAESSAPTERAESFARRSFVYRRLARSGARFADSGGAAVAMQFADTATEIGNVTASRVRRPITAPQSGF